MTEMTPTTWATANPTLAQRVKEVAAVTGKPFSAAIHDAAARLSIRLEWHEADVLAEALSHQHDGIVWVYRMLPRGAYDEVIDSMRRDLRLELLETLHSAGMSLVEDPVETFHLMENPLSPAADTSFWKSPPMSRKDMDRVAGQYDYYFPCVVLTGRGRRLAKAS